MSDKHTSKSFKDWLSVLQQESWQLELLISGFAIFGIIQFFGPLEILQYKFGDEELIYGSLAVSFISTSCILVVITLIIHVILRGLWIGALGLRYVSGDIDYEELKYTEKFSNYLKKRMGSFDKYISKLEDYCSILFAVAFILVFYTLSVFMIFFIIILLKQIFPHQKFSDYSFSSISLFIILLFLAIGSFLTFVDMLTRGFLKKKKWLAFIYYPFYRVFSIITLSFLYRPLIYNFLDNKLGKRISYVLIPFYVGLMIISALSYKHSNYLSIDTSKPQYPFTHHYQDLLTKEYHLVNYAAIPSKVITTSYLPLFIKFTKLSEDDVFLFNEGLKPKKDLRGISFTGIKIEDSLAIKKDSLVAQYLKTYSKICIVKIDNNLYENLDFTFTENKQNQKGFETYIDIENLSKGKHTISISRMRKSKDSIYSVNIDSFPFWYFKE